MTYIITFASSKGGSGKSTFCLNLAAYFGLRGRNVTILDTDFQKSSHDWVRESSDECLANVKTYVANEENSIRQYIKQSRCDILCKPPKTGWGLDKENLSLIPNAPVRCCAWTRDHHAIAPLGVFSPNPRKGLLRFRRS